MLISTDKIRIMSHNLTPILLVCNAKLSLVNLQTDATITNWKVVRGRSHTISLGCAKDFAQIKLEMMVAVAN